MSNLNTLINGFDSISGAAFGGGGGGGGGYRGDQSRNAEKVRAANAVKAANAAKIAAMTNAMPSTKLEKFVDKTIQNVKDSVHPCTAAGGAAGAKVTQQVSKVAKNPVISGGAGLLTAAAVNAGCLIGLGQ